jgi:hypothetical protein
VHAGKITLAGGGSVTIEIRPGQQSYTGSTRNGITSNDYGSWSGSFVVLAATAASAGVGKGGSTWDAKAGQFRAYLGARFAYTCPPGGTAHTVWGSGVYTDDSSVCTAGVHAGVVTLAAGGGVTIEMRAGESSYSASTRNGVTTVSYGSWGGSFVVVGARAGGGAGGGGAGAGGGPAPIGAPGPLPPPRPSVSVNVRAGGGAPLVKLPGSSRFVPLQGGAQIPVGATVDVTRGSIVLQSAEGTARFSGGAFQVREQRAPSSSRVTELKLAGGDFGVCPKKTKRHTAAAKPRIVRQVFARGKGHFRTTGRFASATVRGTVWRMEDRCDGTWVHVSSGSVDLHDLRKKKVVRVRAGQTYIAKRPGGYP